MAKIEKSNFIEYLDFLGRKYPRMVLSQGKLEQLKQLNEQQIEQYLDLLYQKFELKGESEEKYFGNFTRETASIIEVETEEVLPVILPEKPEEKLPEKPVIIQVEETRTPEAIVPEASVTQSVPVRAFQPPTVPAENPVITKPVVNIPPPRPPVYSENTVKPRYRYNYWRIGLVFFLLLAGAYTVYKFIAYQKLGYIYVLTDELLVRTSSGKAGKVMGSMNLFGKAKGKDNKEVNTRSELKLYSNEKQGAFYKVIMSDTPFLSYLLNWSDAGYVYAKYVTTDKKEQETYQKIFTPVKDDYYELKNLEFSYRAILVNAITTQPELKDLILKEPCDIPPVSARNAPLRIGQYQNKDKTVFFVLVQLSDGNYYCIEGDGFYNALPAKPVYFSGETITTEGKFLLKGDYFTWQSCDKTMTAQSSHGDFSSFEMGYTGIE